MGLGKSSRGPLPDILNEFDCFNLDIFLLGIVTVISDNFFKI